VSRRVREGHFRTVGGDLISRVLAYIRVSARDQNPQLQIDAIHASGYDLLFTGKVDPVG
jgi:hypothetical protein